MSKKVDLTQLQKEIVLNILNGENISVLRGLPGSGKTNVMREVARHYRENGYNIIGTAMSASAAIELGSAANIKAMSITKFRYETERQNNSINSAKDFRLNLSMDYFQEQSLAIQKPFSNKFVLIVDEASMVSLIDMHWIVERYIRLDAKLILIGDSGQLSSIGIPGAFENIASFLIPVCLMKSSVRIACLIEKQVC
ncbi:MAG UNVERIFIED_CONTAM: AAA family ATPase [Rickettsiaceae bacterium]